MVKHMIMWQLKGELTEEEKEAVKKGIKIGLEGLNEKIPGLLEIKVQTECLPTSNVDVLLDSTFTDLKALEAYSNDPLHLAVANGKVRPFTRTRMCMDFEI